jgi:hypothetical protein
LENGGRGGSRPSDGAELVEGLGVSGRLLVALGGWDGMAARCSGVSHLSSRLDRDDGGIFHLAEVGSLPVLRRSAKMACLLSS